MRDPEETVDRDVQRLVDGELSVEDEQRLLQMVAGTPDGWRQVALAFLEDAAFRRSVRGYRADAMIASGSGPLLPSLLMRTSGDVARRASWPRGSAAWWCSTAAALVLMFGTGFWLGSETSWDGGAVVQLDAEPAETLHGVADSGSTTEANDVATIASVNGSAPVVVETADLDAWLAWGDRPVAPESVRESLREAGHQLVERRHWVTVPLDDGRTGFMPVCEWVVSEISAENYH